MEKRPTYDDVYRIIAMYCPKNLPLFADGWNRFPCGVNAMNIAADLDAQADFWGRPGSLGDAGLARAIRNAAREIRTRAELK